jgi:hypothetical protein
MGATTPLFLFLHSAFIILPLSAAVVAGKELPLPKESVQ